MKLNLCGRHIFALASALSPPLDASSVAKADSVSTLKSRSCYALRHTTSTTSQLSPVHMDSGILQTRLAKSSASLFCSPNSDKFRHLFLDPLHTLLSSDNHHSPNAIISLHDIAEAYHTLMRRVQQHGRSLDTSSAQSSALQALTQEKANLAYIIRRDILRALEPPILVPSPEGLSPKDHTDNLSDAHERLRKAHTDEVLACHGSLKLVMEVFQSPFNNATLNGMIISSFGVSSSLTFLL